jgi:putative ATP-binding cassette transporter
MSKVTWLRFVYLSKPYFVSEARRSALGLLAALVALLLVMSGLNVINSYVGRDFMTAIAERQPEQVYLLALSYLAVFAAATAVGAFSQLTEQVLGLRWRNWLTRRFLALYFRSQAYSRIKAHNDVDNPDQRIAEDIRTFTATTLSFFIMTLNSVITVLAFSEVLWSITPWLFLVSVLYPLLGTMLVMFIGRHLVWLNNQQLKKEADFRFELVRAREHAESIALVHAEQKEQTRLGDFLSALVTNYRTIIGVLFRLKFFTGGYNFLTQLIPVLIVAPRYLNGEVEFGVVTQAAMAFSQVFNAFSLIVEEFQNLSVYAAVIDRLGTLREAIAVETEPPPSAVHVVEDASHLAFQHVTLRTPKGDRVLIRDLTLEIPRGQRVLVTGPNGAGKSALIRAAAGLWDRGQGRIVRPTPREVLFLPERPYMVFGTLRDQFQTAVGDSELNEDRINSALRAVNLEPLVERLGGLDVAHDWAQMLSLGEQELFAFARLLLARPAFAFLDQAATALSEPRWRGLYHRLAETSMTYISAAEHEAGLADYHDVQLELHLDGSWEMGSIRKQHQSANGSGKTERESSELPDSSSAN